MVSSNESESTATVADSAPELAPAPAPAPAADLAPPPAPAPSPPPADGTPATVQKFNAFEQLRVVYEAAKKAREDSDAAVLAALEVQKNALAAEAKAKADADQAGEDLKTLITSEEP